MLQRAAAASAGPPPSRPARRTTPATWRPTATWRAPQEREGAGLGRRRVDGQQRPLDAAAAEPAISLTAAAPAVAVVRPAADERRPDRHVPASRRASSTARIDAWSGGRARAVDPRDDDASCSAPGPSRARKGEVDEDGPALLAVLRRAGPSTRSRPSWARAAWDDDVARLAGARPARPRASAAGTTRGPPTSGAAPAGAGGSPARARPPEAEKPDEPRAAGAWRRAARTRRRAAGPRLRAAAAAARGDRASAERYEPTGLTDAQPPRRMDRPRRRPRARRGRRVPARDAARVGAQRARHRVHRDPARDRDRAVGRVGARRGSRSCPAGRRSSACTSRSSRSSRSCACSCCPSRLARPTTPSGGSRRCSTGRRHGPAALSPSRSVRARCR